MNGFRASKFGLGFFLSGPPPPHPPPEFVSCQIVTSVQFGYGIMPLVGNLRGMVADVV